MIVYDIIRFFIKYRTYLTALAIVLSLWGAFTYAKSIGKEDCRKEQENALLAASQKARFELVQLEKKYANAAKKIKEIPDGGCVGPANAYINEWMREHYMGK